MRGFTSLAASVWVWCSSLLWCTKTLVLRWVQINKYMYQGYVPPVFSPTHWIPTSISHRHTDTYFMMWHLITHPRLTLSDISTGILMETINSCSQSTFGSHQTSSFPSQVLQYGYSLLNMHIPVIATTMKQFLIIHTQFNNFIYSCMNWLEYVTVQISAKVNVIRVIYVHVPHTIRVRVDWIPRESNVHSVPYTYTLHVRVRVRVRIRTCNV